jgi:hypothetical protein
MEGSRVAILLLDRSSTSMARMVKTSLGMRDSSLLERSSYLLLLRLAWRRNTLSYEDICDLADRAHLLNLKLIRIFKCYGLWILGANLKLKR